MRAKNKEAEYFSYCEGQSLASVREQQYKKHVSCSIKQITFVDWLNVGLCDELHEGVAPSPCCHVFPGFCAAGPHMLNALSAVKKIATHRT